MYEGLKEIIKNFGKENDRFFVKTKKGKVISTGTVVFMREDGTREEVIFQIFD